MAQTQVAIERALAVAGGRYLPIQFSRIAIAVLTLTFVLASLTGTALSIELQAIGFLFGMVALNLPHGGFEHFENLRWRTASFQLSYVGLYLLGIVGFVAPLC